MTFRLALSRQNGHAKSRILWILILLATFLRAVLLRGGRKDGTSAAPAALTPEKHNA
ncbi:hypothetical protein GCM10010317_027080 [Streptomyces mirabilis]|nr:hypothetical protein GCM10010317_027080 [Streptomyces mirabilis]